MNSKFKSVIIALSAAVGIGLSAWAYNSMNNSAYIDVTSQPREVNLYHVEKGKREVTVKMGMPVYCTLRARDGDGVKTTRFYVNDFLISEHQNIIDKITQGYPTFTASVEGMPVETSGDNFRVGRNVLRFQVEDAKGNKTLDEVIVNLTE